MSRPDDYLEPIILSDEQLVRLCNDSKFPFLPEFSARIALTLPAPKFFPLPGTIEECAHFLAYAHVIINRNETALVKAMWEELSMREISAAETTETAETAYYRVPSFSSEVKAAAWAKWHQFALDDVTNASTLEQAREAYGSTPLDSIARVYAIRKMAELILKEEKEEVGGT